MPPAGNPFSRSPRIIAIAAWGIFLLLAGRTALCPGQTAELILQQPDEPMMLVFPTFLHTWGLQRAGPAHLRLFLGNRTRFHNPQGLAVTVLDTLEGHRTPPGNVELTVYGVNSARGEIIYNTGMTTLAIYGRRGNGPGELLDPHGIDADPHGHVVVADTGNDRIVVLYHDGQQLEHRLDLLSAAGLELRAPYDVALTPGQAVWISDSGSGRLVLMGLDGTHQRTLDVSAIMPTPGALTLTDPRRRWSYYRDEAFFLADRQGGVLVRLNEQGEETARITAAALGLRTMHIRYLAVDFYSNLWATDGANHQVHKFDRELNWLGSFGQRGRGPRQFMGPRGIGIWPRFGQMIIAEQQGAQYYWIGADARRLKARQYGSEVEVELHLEEHAYLTVRARYQGGGLEEALRRQMLPAGPGRISFTLQQPRPLGWLEVVVEPTYSSFTYREKTFHLRFPPEPVP